MPATRVRRQPQRSCVACRETRDKRSLSRLVAGPDGHVRLDSTGRLPGRGAYLCERRGCWERALAGAGALGRALRTSVLPEDREALLAQAPPADEAGAAATVTNETTAPAFTGGGSNA